MIINKINIEGVCTEDELRNITVKDGKIVSESISFNLSNQKGVKDILEISIEVNIISMKSLMFKDKMVGIVTLETDLNIMAVENSDTNGVFSFKEVLFFNHNIDLSENDTGKYQVIVKVIDCYFEALGKRAIVGNVTYLIKEIQEDILIEQNPRSEELQYTLIDLCQEFS